MVMRARGFTYVGMVIAVAIIGLVAASTVKLGSLLERRQAEYALLDIGRAFSDALDSYAAATPAGQRREPARLEDLLRDPRFPGVKRHLRRIDVDPMTGKAEWGLQRTPDKQGILAVYSLSSARPIKIGNFDARFAQFERKARLSDWRFGASGSQAAPEAPPNIVPQQSAQPATETVDTDMVPRAPEASEVDPNAVGRMGFPPPLIDAPARASASASANASASASASSSASATTGVPLKR